MLLSFCASARLLLSLKCSPSPAPTHISLASTHSLRLYLGVFFPEHPSRPVHEAPVPTGYTDSPPPVSFNMLHIFTIAFQVSVRLSPSIRTRPIQTGLNNEEIPRHLLLGRPRLIGPQD